MASKLQKTSRQKSKLISDLLTENEMENEKENNYSKQFVLKGKKIVKEQNTKYVKEKKLRKDELLLSRLKSKETVKPLGFWKKKLQDLEESITNKRCKVYEFSGTDESESSYKKKKKPKQKTKLKKREALVPSYKKPVDQIRKVTEKKLKQIHRQSMCREQIMLTKERKKLANTGKRFTFSIEMPSLGITSTPTVKKDNLVGASKFLFLSPIIMEEETENININKLKKSSAHKLKDVQNNMLTKHFNQETPKLQTKLKTISCIRVLRNGKIINM